MALDIKEGDYLVANGKEYPIRACEAWAWYGGTGIKRLLRVTATTKRQTTTIPVTGPRDAPVQNLTGVQCTPLDPLNDDAVELRNELERQFPNKLLQTFADGGGVFYRLILEDFKR